MGGVAKLTQAEKVEAPESRTELAESMDSAVIFAMKVNFASKNLFSEDDGYKDRFVFNLCRHMPEDKVKAYIYIVFIIRLLKGLIQITSCTA